jgi:hypothetical protein
VRLKINVGLQKTEIILECHIILVNAEKKKRSALLGLSLKGKVRKQVSHDSKRSNVLCKVANARKIFCRLDWEVREKAMQSIEANA